MSKDEQINLVYGDHNENYTFYSSSNDGGSTWSNIYEFSNTIAFAINKIVSHPKRENLCILTHEAHEATSGIHFNYSIDNGLNWESYRLVDNASMAEGLMEENGVIHLTYNQIIGTEFSLNYIYSTNGGTSFSTPIPLFHGEIFQNPLPQDLLAITGESQSMLMGQDNMLHMTFIDWSDGTKAKHLIFEPFNFLSSSENNSEDIAEISLFPNPTQDYLNITLENSSKFSNWSIHSMDGAMVSDGLIRDENLQSINLSYLENGSYFIRFYSENTILVKMFMKV